MIPLAIAAAGTLASARADQVQGTQRRDKLNEALMRTDKAQGVTDTKVLNEAQTLSPVARAAAMTTQANTNADASKADLAAAGATDANGNAIINTSGDDGAVSRDFLTAKADRALTEGSRLSAIAQQLAKTRAPGQLEQQEGQRRADLGENLGSMWGDVKADNNATQLDAEGIQAPMYGKLGKLAQMAALAYMTGGAGAPTVTGLGAAGGGMSAGAVGGASSLGAMI